MCHKKDREEDVDDDTNRLVKHYMFCDRRITCCDLYIDCNKNETPMLEVSSRMDWFDGNYWRVSFNNKANGLAISLKFVRAEFQSHSLISS